MTVVKCAVRLVGPLYSEGVHLVGNDRCAVDMCVDVDDPETELRQPALLRLAYLLVMNRPAWLQHQYVCWRYVVVTTSQQPGTGAHQYAQQPHIPQQASPYGHQQPGMPPAPAPAPALSRRDKRWPWVLGIIGAFIVGIIVGGAGDGSTSTPNAAPVDPAPTATAPAVSAPAASSAPAAPAVPAVPAGPATEVEDGTYQVGTDMAAGRYKTAGPSADSIMDMCYSARMKDDSGDVGSIIANDIVKGQSSITVKAGEFVKFSGGCTWTKQ